MVDGDWLTKRRRRLTLIIDFFLATILVFVIALLPGERRKTGLAYFSGVMIAIFAVIGVVTSVTFLRGY